MRLSGAILIAVFIAAGLAATLSAQPPVQPDEMETFPAPDDERIEPEPRPYPPQIDDPPEPGVPEGGADEYIDQPLPRPPLAVSRLVVTDEVLCALSQGGWIACFSLVNGEVLDAPEGPFAALTAGAAHFCALDAWGQPQCWGDNDLGQLEAPRQPMIAISAGDAHTCGLSILGEPICWGDLDAAHLAPPAGPFQEIAAAGDRTCAAGPIDAPHCWGQPTEPARPFGEAVYGLRASSEIICGIDIVNDPRCEFTPQATAFEPPRELAVQVAPGDDFVCVLDTLGDVHCSGPGAPALPEEALMVSHIAASENLLCAVTVLDDILCWNQDGEFLSL